MNDQESFLYFIKKQKKCILNFKIEGIFVFVFGSKTYFIALNVTHKMQDSFVFSLLECGLYKILFKWIKILGFIIVLCIHMQSLQCLQGSCCSQSTASAPELFEHSLHSCQASDTQHILLSCFKALSLSFTVSLNI